MVIMDAELREKRENLDWSEEEEEISLVGIPQESPQTEPFMTVVTLFRLYAAGIDQRSQFRRFP